MLTAKLVNIKIGKVKTRILNNYIFSILNEYFITKDRGCVQGPVLICYGAHGLFPGQTANIWPSNNNLFKN